MGIYTNEEVIFRRPHLFDKDIILNLRKELFNKQCKFKGTSELNLYPNFLDWLAYTLNISKFKEDGVACGTYIAIRKSDNELIGMAEIKFSSGDDLVKTAHIIECVRPSERRKGYGRLILQKGVEECRSLGIKSDKLTFERNSRG